MYVVRLLISAICLVGFLCGGFAALAAEQAGAKKEKPKVHARIQQNSEESPIAKEAGTKAAVPVSSKTVSKAQYVFVGKVIKADLSRGFWSGFYLCYKPVQFEVIAVAKGQIPSPTVEVSEVLLGPNERVLETAQLNPEYYPVGKQLIIFADDSLSKYDDRIYLSNAITYSDSQWATIVNSLPKTGRP